MNITYRWLGIGTVLALLLVGHPANAELLSIDLSPGSGDQLLLHDTVTGLDWLDVAQTRNESYDQVRTGIWYQMGFRHATIDQVRTLFEHAGVPDDGFDIEATHPAEAAALIRSLGVTIVGDEGREGTWGFVGNDFFGNFITLSSHPIGQVFSALLGKVDHLPATPSGDIPELGEGHFTGGHPFSDEANQLWGSFLVRPHAWPQRDLFLHVVNTTDSPSLTIDGLAPTSSTAASKDSGSISFNGGNQWREVGTWTVLPVAPTETVNGLTDLRVWLGLKTSDDQGTRFDVRAELYRTEGLIASGLIRCVSGITRNPSSAMEVQVPFDSFTPTTINEPTDVLRLRVLTRIGTNSDGTKCGGHNSAAGLRLYFDGVDRASQFGATAP